MRTIKGWKGVRFDSDGGLPCRQLRNQLIKQGRSKEQAVSLIRFALDIGNLTVSWRRPKQQLPIQ